MNSFFSTQARRAAIATEAATWLGTPFMPNAAVKGAGVSCQKLVGEIYLAMGVWPAGFAIPEWPLDFGDPILAKAMCDWMDGQKDRFEDVSELSVTIPGDMVGFRIGPDLKHLGIVLTSSGSFIHCLRGPGVMMSELRDATYLKRIEKIWRPITQ